MKTAEGNSTLGLSMIVKDESHVITRVLNSIYRHIDYWAIVDTGSTDGTQDIIRNFFAEKNIPGELIETPWVDFSTCRNISLEAIEKVTDYGIWIDADEEFIPHDRFNMKIALATNLDTVSIPTKYGGVDYTRKSIWKCGRNFFWAGPIHELLSSTEEKTGGILQGAHVLVRAEGNSWKDIKKKYTEHAIILEKYTETNPDTRWVFYIAQSWRDASEHEKSFEWYKKRSEMADGFSEEIFFSLFMMARLAEIMNWEKSKVIGLYNDAHKADPLRGEPIKSLIQYLHRCKDFETSYIYSRYGLRYHGHNPYPTRILFLDNQLYQFQMQELHALSCYYTKRIEEGAVAYWEFRTSVKENDLTPQQAELMSNNEKFFLPYDKIKHLVKGTNSDGSMSTMQNNPRINAQKKPGSNYTPPKKKRKK